MNLYSFLKPRLIDTWRWGTWPWRCWAHASARKKGTMPVAVLFYHRVADSDPNPWTISCAAFRKQIDWLSDHFDLVSLEEAQDRIRSGHNSRPTVSITFDDGYADNTSFALPLLIKRGIPVTYFVTTGHTTSGSPFDHDIDRGQPLVPNSLEGLQAMAQAGVEIGGHTRSHANLASLTDSATLFDEVVTATREMEQVIGKKIRFFAFPYGQLENLSSEVFQLAREHGILGICSAYGGWNEIGGDPFHLQRFHGDPEIAYLKNWLTLDPRKRKMWQTPLVERMIRESQRSAGFQPSQSATT